MSGPILQVRHLEKSFGTHQVLRDIDFEVEKGEVISIIGSSGSGKSTLLRCINMLETPSGGEIVFEGAPVSYRPKDKNYFRSKVGMVFQSFNLFANMNALKNCMIGPQIVNKKSKQEAEALARKGWAATPVEAMEWYLLPGRPGWVEKNSPSPKACGAVIHQAGGLAYLAHLDRIGRRDRQRGLLVARQVLEEAGLDGLEARYATYDRQWEALADSLAAERGLLRSGGSDFHGGRKPNRLGEGLGQLFVPVAWAEKPGD